MKSKTKKNLLYISLILLVLSVIAASTYFFGNKQSTISGGSTILSISNVEVTDNGNMIRITGVAGTGAEAMSISISKSKFNSYISDDGYLASSGITGSMILTKQIKSFLINKQENQNFYEYSTQKVGIFSDCPSRSGYVLFSVDGLPISLFNKLCHYGYSRGINSEFTGVSISNSEVKVKIGNAEGTLKPSSGVNTLLLNDGETEIQWTGDLLNYIQTTTPGYDVLFSESKFKNLIQDGSYNSYESSKQSFYNCLGIANQEGFLGITFNEDTFNECISSFNNRLNTILTSRNSDYINSGVVDSLSFDTESQTKGYLNVDLKVASSFPTFTITLPADKVGIIKLSGDPQIVSCITDFSVNSGDTVQKTIKVKNAGTSDGSFTGSVQCSNGITGWGSEKYVSSNTESDITFILSGINTNVGTITSSCVFTITDRTSQKSVSCTSNIDVSYQSGIICEPDKYSCKDINTLRQCDNTGMNYIDTACEEGCTVLQSGEAICVGEESDVLSKEQCEEKSTANPLLGYEWIDSQTVSCGFLCNIGLSEPKVTENSYCKATFLPYWILGGFLFLLLILIFIVVIIQLSKGNKHKRKKR